MEGQAEACTAGGNPAARNPANRPRFELAGASDEPELRRLLRENPMAGEIRLSLEREPDYFAAAAVEGPRHDTIVARDPVTGRIAGIGSRSVRQCFVNGKPVMLPYLGVLRIEREWRGRRHLLAGGYTLCRDLRRPDEAPYCLTSIVADNRPARRLLGAGIPGLPTYREVESFVTVAVPARERRPVNLFNVTVQPGSMDRLGDIVSCLDRNGRRHQFAPRWTAEDLLSPQGTRDLRLEDFFLAVRRGEVVGCAALWDQRGFKQAIVRGYSRGLARLRPLLNLAAPWLGTPTLPRIGCRVEQAFLSHIAVDEDDSRILEALLEAAQAAARARGCSCIVLGLAERNPMLSELQRAFRHRAYRSVIYVVHWTEDAGAVPPLDGRPLHVEVATL